MNRLLKLLHLLGVAGFLGPAIASLVLAAASPHTTAEAFAVSRATISIVCSYVALPALLLTLASGLLLMLNQDAFVRARWVRAKAALGAAIALVALLAWLPAVNRIAALGQSGAFGSPMLDAQHAAEQVELLGGAVVVALAIAAVAVAVYRPKLGSAAGR